MTSEQQLPRFMLVLRVASVLGIVAIVWRSCPPSDDTARLVTSAREAYERDDHQEAFTAHQAAVDSLGPNAPHALLFDTALLAVLAHSPRDAEIAAARAAAMGADVPWVEARAAYLRGHAAWERCLVLAAQASGPEAGPADLLLAIRAAEDAKTAWVEAACGPSAWMEATRNAERADRKLEELRAQEEAMARGKTRRENAGQDPGAPGTPPQQAPKLVQRMLEQLAARERAKQDLRRRTRNENGKPVEKDW